MDTDRPIITKSAGETKKVGSFLAHYFVKKIKKGTLTGPVVICLYGQLGSGKTTFTQGFASGLGIKDRLLSPTFIIVRHYEIQSLHRYLNHVDCYRMDSKSDLASLGLNDIYTDPYGFTVIEWADRLGSDLPEKRLDIRFDQNNNSSHSIDITHDSYGFTHT